MSDYYQEHKIKIAARYQERKIQKLAYQKAYDALHKEERRAYERKQRALGYSNWSAMKKRCYDPKHASYHRYGAIGVKVCDRWRYGENGKSGFECMIEDIGPRPSLQHTLSRRGDIGNYEPGNVCWSDTNFPQTPECFDIPSFLPYDDKKEPPRNF